MSKDTTDQNAEVVVKSDTVNLAQTSRRLWVGATGDISVEMVGIGSAIIFKAVPVGWLDIAVTRVNSTNTGASDMVAVR